MYCIERQIVLPLSLAEAWAFFSNPHNLSKITPVWLGFEVTSQPPTVMYEGMIITYRVRPFAGIPVRWMTEITHIRHGEYFVDEQRAGPYKVWHHQHFFREVTGGVEVGDRVDFALPFGPLGDLAYHLYVRSALQNIFDFRTQTLRELFKS